MTVVVLGIDALDPELLDPDLHPNLALEGWSAIDTIVSSSGEPSTHELWPTIITGLEPHEHGLKLDEGVAWQNPLLRIGRDYAGPLIPDGVQSKIGSWLLNNTDEDAFRTPANYYPENGLDTVFGGRQSKAIGIPNYVVDPTDTDREHELRKDMGELFERDSDARGGHRSSDPVEFYELCMEMSMVRIALTRRALRSKKYELVFGYTSGLDLIGHVSYQLPELQKEAYQELDDFVGELRDDLRDEDELVLVSDHGLQDGVHTHQAVVASTQDEIPEDIEDVTDLYSVINRELEDRDHVPEKKSYEESGSGSGAEVKEQLEDLGYM